MEKKDLRTDVMSKRHNFNMDDASKSFFVIATSGILGALLYWVVMIISGILSGMELAELERSQYGLALQSVMIQTMFLLFFFWYSRKQRIHWTSATAVKNKVNVWFVLLSVLLAIICVATFAPIVELLYKPLEAIGFKLDGTVGYEMNTWWRVVIGCVIYGLIPAVAEELVVRGMLQKGLMRKCTPFCAIFISTFAFFIMHGSLMQTFYQIILGVLAGLITYKCGNLLYSVIFHCVNNLLVIFMGLLDWPKYISRGFETNAIGIIVPILLAVVGVFAVFGVLWLIKKIKDKKQISTDELIVDGDNIIIEEEQEKISLKTFVNALTNNQKFYFGVGLFISALIWLSNTFSLL